MKLNPEHNPGQLEPHDVYRFVKMNYAVERIVLDLKLRNYGETARLVLSSEGKYSIEDVIIIAKKTIVKLKQAVASSRNIVNSESITQPSSNVEYSDALYNARVIALSVPELKPLLEEALNS
jgi:hypothetical protein